VRRSGWTNEVVRISNLRGAPRIETVCRPAGDTILRDLDLDFDARRFLFSGINAGGRWALFESVEDGSGIREVTPAAYADVDWFDGCYTPDGRIVMLGTAAYQGCPACAGACRWRCSICSTPRPARSASSRSSRTATTRLRS
jgi:hypothetical protein